VFTLVYSMGWSFVASPRAAVVVVAVALALTLALGFIRFVLGCLVPARS
jgi:hypothetical protein